jgi:thermitase
MKPASGRFHKTPLRGFNSNWQNHLGSSGAEGCMDGNRLRKAKISCVILLLFVVLAFLTREAEALKVQIAGDRLTLKAESVPLQDLLTSFTREGIRVRVDPKINPAVTASFEDQDIQKALEWLLKDLDYVLIWDSIQGPKGQIPRLAEIQIFRPGRKDLMRPIQTRRVLAVVRNPEDGSYYVKDEVLLRLKPGTNLQKVEALLKKWGGRVVDSYVDLGIYRIRLPEGTDVPALVKEIQEQVGTGSAELNFAYPIPRSSRDIEFPPVDPAASPSENPVPIAVIDSGLNPQVRLDKYVLASLDALNPDQSISDAEGHGTQMALVAAGLIKPFGAEESKELQAPIIPIRAFDENGFTSNFLLMQSIDFALEHGARVMSLSWGSETKSEFLGEALDSAYSKGLIIVAAVGNEPTGLPEYPAAYPSVLGVGALGPDGRTWEKSNRGDFVALYAPGFAAMPVGYRGEAGVYAGTSISTAFAANRIASILAGNPKASREEIIKALQNSR